MNLIELTESQIMELLEKGEVDSGSCLIRNIDNKEVVENEVSRSL